MPPWQNVFVRKPTWERVSKSESYLMVLDQARVQVAHCRSYDGKEVAAALPDALFQQINPGDAVVLKPNWVFECHRYRKNEWEYVITHPSVIDAVLRKVLKRLDGKGRISIMDGPMTDACFDKLMAHYPLRQWEELAREQGVQFEIIDLRDSEWTVKDGVIVERKELPGDPRGKVVVDLEGEKSEFWGQRKSRRGYYGADYNLNETNQAHDGTRNLYSVSRTVLESDVFINLPKLKTHRKAGITCCLKNLVGINTYKNYLPHHSEGGPGEGGDQFPSDNLNSKLEGPLITFVKQHLLQNEVAARILAPLKKVALRLFGDSSSVVRSGSWHGNDTLWRTIVDLNKVLLYCSPQGEMAADPLPKAKRYIGVVDAVLAGEGDGPLAPDPVGMGYLVSGSNPVALDAACAALMGFDAGRIRSIARSFSARSYPLCGFTLREVRIVLDGWEGGVDDLPPEKVVPLRAHAAWRGAIEKNLPPAPRPRRDGGSDPLQGPES